MEEVKRYVQELYDGKITPNEFKEKYITLIIQQVITQKSEELWKK